MNNFRTANIDDANFLATLVAESSGGVWPAVWKAMAKNGESVNASAIRYLTNTTNNLSIRNSILYELNSSCVAAMISYQEDAAPVDQTIDRDESTLPHDLYDALTPYRELSDPNSLFIAELCSLPEARGQGVGTKFLEKAKDIAIERGLPCVSLRVFSANSGAVRLYERFGFKIEGRRQVIPYQGIEIEGFVYLMVYPV